MSLSLTFVFNRRLRVRISDYQRKLAEHPEDLYKVMGVNENATYDEIKKAYKAKAREYHPDKNYGTIFFIPIHSSYTTYG